MKGIMKTIDWKLNIEFERKTKCLIINKFIQRSRARHTQQDLLRRARDREKER